MKRNLDDLSDVYPKPKIKITSLFLDLANCFVEYYCMKYQDPCVFSYMKSGYEGFRRYSDSLHSLGVKSPDSFLEDLVSAMDLFRSRRSNQNHHDFPHSSTIQPREFYFVIARELLKNDDVDLQVYFAELMAKREKLCSLLGVTHDPTTNDYGTMFKRGLESAYKDIKFELHDEPYLLNVDLDRFSYPEDFISNNPIKTMIKKIDQELEDKMGISYLVQEKKPFRPIPLGLALNDWDNAEKFIFELLENKCPLDKLIHHAKKVFGDKWHGELPRIVDRSKGALSERDWSDLMLLSRTPEHFAIRYLRRKHNFNSAQEVDEEILVTSNGLCSFKLRNGRSNKFQLEPSQVHQVLIQIARLRPEDTKTGLQGFPTKDKENEDLNLVLADKEYSWQNESDWGEEQYKFNPLIELLKNICSSPTRS